MAGSRVQARQDSTGFAQYLAALDARHEATGRQIILVLDNGPCHVSKRSQAALVARSAWLEVIPLARYSPHLNPIEWEWRLLKRDHGGHLASTLRDFVDEIVAGLRGLGGQSARSLMRCRNGGWTGIARHRPVARQDAPSVPRTVTPRQSRTSFPAPT